MSEVKDWYHLRNLLRQGAFTPGMVENQFFARLLRVLGDHESGIGDRLAAYRDALLAGPGQSQPVGLPIAGPAVVDEHALYEWGLCLDPGHGELSLRENAATTFVVSDGALDTSAVYRLVERRNIKKFPMDPSLTSALRVERYQHYHGAGQRDAIRLLLTDDRGSTFLVDLPTGVGKTFLVEAVDAFSMGQGLTVVIVPTVSLAMDQGVRVAERLGELGEDHGGSYCWHGGIAVEERRAISARIRAGKQRVLICSPEAALTSLRWSIVYAAKAGLLGSVFIDEAHLVDHWGAEFRPDFQGLAALVKTCRRHASTVGKRMHCILLSATYGPKTVRVLEKLFVSSDDRLISIHGGFLRPEIQYAVCKVTKENHHEAVLQAVRSLPKPMILYVTEREQAEQFYLALKNTVQLSRLAKFTGQTNTAERDEILRGWRDGAIDLVVATSAFGVGINKPDVRSVLHASVPENIDRFYQEVGRSGRDGKASQSLIVFHRGQFHRAERLNTQKLISEELGLDRWAHLWAQGRSAEGGKREIELGVIPNRLEWRGGENEKWNWRTLMLMQRAGGVEVELALPELEGESKQEAAEGDEVSDNACPEFTSVRLWVTTLADNHRDESFWSSQVTSQRSYEKREQAKSFHVLKQWLLHPNEQSLCQHLVDYYTTEGLQPERVCAGCPACRSQGIHTDQMPTVGMVSHISGFEAPWDWPTCGFPHAPHVAAYFAADASSSGVRFVDDWSYWIGPLLVNGMIDAIRSTVAVLHRVQERLPRGLRRYWVGLDLDQAGYDQSVWRELVIVPPSYARLPNFGLSDVPRILLAPDVIPSKRHPARRWWEDDVSAMALQALVERLEHVTYK